MDVRTTLPCQLTSRGRPTLTEMTFMIVRQQTPDIQFARFVLGTGLFLVTMLLMLLFSVWLHVH